MTTENTGAPAPEATEAVEALEAVVEGTEAVEGTEGGEQITEDQFSSRFAALSRKEKMLRDKEALIKAGEDKYKKYEDLDSVSDAVALAEEIKAHINVILISGKIKEVYFKELVVN